MNKNNCLVFHLVLVIVSLPYERFCAILSVSMQISQTKIENCANFSDGPVQKRFEIAPSFFAVMLTGPSTSKKCFMFTFKNHQMLVILSQEKLLFKNI